MNEQRETLLSGLTFKHPPVQELDFGLEQALQYLFTDEPIEGMETEENATIIEATCIVEMSSDDFFRDYLLSNQTKFEIKLIEHLTLAQQLGNKFQSLVANDLSWTIVCSWCHSFNKSRVFNLIDKSYNNLTPINKDTFNEGALMMVADITFKNISDEDRIQYVLTITASARLVTADEEEIEWPLSTITVPLFI